MACVCVCVPTTKHLIIVLEQGLREIFDLKSEGIAGDEKIAQWRAAWLVLVSECWWMVN